MTSWRLLTHPIPLWDSDAETPVFRRELALAPIWKQAPVSLARAALPALALCLFALLLGIARGGQPLASLCFAAVTSLVVLLVPSLLAWALPLGAILAPVVVGERERGTWDLLRVTPLPTETILLGKARGALWRLRQVFVGLRAMVVAVALLVGFLSLGLIEHTNWHGSDPPYPAVCGVAVVIVAAGAALFVIDRAQQFVLMALAALAASAAARSSRAALPGATTAALVAWLADTGAGIVLLALLPGTTTDIQGRLPALVMLGPTANVLANLPLPQAAAGVALTLIGREIAVRLLWRWTVHAAA